MSQHCSARSKQKGKQCGHWAIPGGTVCRYHGGLAPQVEAKAKERLSALFPRSVTVLSELLEKIDFPTVQYQVAKFIAEQEVGRAKETAEVTVKGVGDMTDEELRDKALALAAVVHE